MKLVIDTSVALKWFVEEPSHEAAKAILDTNEFLYAPDLVVAEVTNSLWRKVRVGEAGVDQVHAAIEEVHSFFRLAPASVELMRNAFDLARLLSHSVYDCMFLAHAILLKDAVLITADAKFAEKAVSSGFADLVRTLDAAPIRIAFSNEALDKLLKLYRTSAQTLDHVGKSLRKHGSSERFHIINISELAPAFASPSYIRLTKQVGQLSPHQAAVLIATCWLGRGYDGHDFFRLYRQAEHLAQSPSQHAAYVISLLSYLEAGIASWQRR